MRIQQTLITGCLVLLMATARAELAVKTEPVKVSGQKAIIKLEMKNTFTNAIDSARAAVFLSDENGKVVGQATRWVIGGGEKNRPPLQPDDKTTFNFVVQLNQGASTNLQTSVLFNRILLDGGRAADVRKEVKVESDK